MNTSNGLSRKDFLKNSVLAMAGLALSSNRLGATSIFNDATISSKEKLALKNVRLETY